ncbi:MAG: Ldh family oxidoreductase [Rhodospirillales bacterium]|nr:Ldh family oxidoreductase [Rhodospirillales bacterium]
MTDLRRSMALVFRAAGASGERADAMAAMLLEANRAGHDSHGIQMVHSFPECPANRSLDVTGEPSVTADLRGAVIRIDTNDQSDIEHDPVP